jgi:hyperosmotically inducible protein
MNTNQWLFRVLAVGTLSFASVASPVLAQNTQSTDKSTTTDSQSKADNTRQNKKDRTMTADRSTKSASDRELTQKIRKAIVDDKTLSSYAHNVKIITKDGMVTLRGPVRTEDEKKTVEAKASEIAGSGKVTNDITIAPSKGSKSKTDTSAKSK